LAFGCCAEASVSDIVFWSLFYVPHTAADDIGLHALVNDFRDTAQGSWQGSSWPGQTSYPLIEK
jgi:hypothetical protein